MPEGDTIHHAANRIRPVLAGRVPDEIVTPHPRFGMDRWPQRLAGRAVEAVDAHGKHLFIHWEDGLVLHSHLRMTGAWKVVAEGRRWRRSATRAWLVLRAGGHEVVQFDGPVLELMTESRARFDQRLAGLGPDVLADEFDARRFLRRLREDDQTRPIGDALLEQRNARRAGHDLAQRGPVRRRHRPVAADGRRQRRRRAGRGRGDPAADGALGPRGLRPARRQDLRPQRPALPALRDARAIRQPGRQQPPAVLVPGVPAVTEATPSRAALKRIGHKGADHIAPGNTLESFDAALAAGVDMVEFDVLPDSWDSHPRLVLAHDLHDIGARTPLTLEEGLAHFSQDAWAGVDLIVDLKLPGYEERVVNALRDHGLGARALISTMETSSLATVRAAAPEIRLGWSVPRVRRNPFEHPVTRLAAKVAARYGQVVVPPRVARALREGAHRCGDGPLGARRPTLRPRGRARRRRALRVDRRRPAADRHTRAPWRDRCDHERPAAVRRDF